MSSNTKHPMAHADDKQAELIERRQDCFRFLDLPGDLRNMVYSYAIDDCILYLDKSSTSSYSPSPQWSDLQRQSLDITQTCRQIRQEMMPLYRHHVRPILTHAKFLAYMSTVFPDPVGAFETLIVCFPFIMCYKESADFKHLMNLVTSAQDLKLEIRTSPVPPQYYIRKSRDFFRIHLLDAFLDPHRNKAGMKRAAEMCKSITFRTMAYAPFGSRFIRCTHRLGWGGIRGREKRRFCPRDMSG